MSKKRGQRKAVEAQVKAAASMATSQAGNIFGAYHSADPANHGIINNIGNSARFAAWNPGQADADSDTIPGLNELRGLCRDAERNQPIATGAVENLVTYTIGTGLTLQSAINAEYLGLSDKEARAYQSEFELYFNTWAGSKFADYSNKQNFYDIQDLTERAELVSGDAFVALVQPKRVPAGWPYRIALQVIEADRVCNENGVADTDKCTQGIEKIDDVPVAAWIANCHPRRTLTYKPGGIKWNRVEFFTPATGRHNLLHLWRMKRPQQTRGIPWLAPVLGKLKQADRYSNAELDAAVNAAINAIFMTMDHESFTDLLDQDSKEKYIQKALGFDRVLESATGKVVNLFPGETIETPAPGRPNPSFTQFFDAVTGEVAVGLNLPREVVMKVFNSSYSASRAALMDAWKTYQVRRFRKAFNFCQPIYEEILADAVALGRFILPGFLTDPIARAAWCGSKWSGDGMMALDPLKEANAAARRMEVGITTLPAETIAYDGGDWEANHKVSAKVQAERLKDGLVAPLVAPMVGGPPPQGPDYSEEPEGDDDKEDDENDDEESTEDRE